MFALSLEAAKCKCRLKLISCKTNWCWVRCDVWYKISLRSDYSQHWFYVVPTFTTDKLQSKHTSKRFIFDRISTLNTYLQRTQYHSINETVPCYKYTHISIFLTYYFNFVYIILHITLYTCTNRYTQALIYVIERHYIHIRAITVLSKTRFFYAMFFHLISVLNFIVRLTCKEAV